MMKIAFHHNVKTQILHNVRDMDLFLRSKIVGELPVEIVPNRRNKRVYWQASFLQGLAHCKDEPYIQLKTDHLR